MDLKKLINKLTILSSLIISIFAMGFVFIGTFIQAFVTSFSSWLGTFWSVILTPIAIGAVLFISLMVVYLLFSVKKN